MVICFVIFYFALYACPFWDRILRSKSFCVSFRGNSSSSLGRNNRNDENYEKVKCSVGKTADEKRHYGSANCHAKKRNELPRQRAKQTLSPLQ